MLYVSRISTLVCTTLLALPIVALTAMAADTSAVTSAAFLNVPPAVQAAQALKAAQNARPAHAAPSGYKSYREWRSYMIEAAASRVQKTQKNLESQRNDPNARQNSNLQAGLSPQLSALQNQLEKEELQVSMASELTISDYFVGYITQQKNVPDTIKDVAGKLSPEEVAELMAAYADRFFKSSRSDHQNKAISGSNTGFQGE